MQTCNFRLLFFIFFLIAFHTCIIPLPLSFANDSTGLLASVNGEPVTLKLYEASVSLRLASMKFLHGNAAPSDKAIRRAKEQSSALLVRRMLVIQELKRK